ncbi:hypothetical protein BT96DRAFT_1019975 [Gymnopus androsaceus JB14]|uniref:Uncharacterized protein n=1 Tax=Gymnopus androsaceus JB14 TaxID=1447944 RepID=A0A6A4HPP3_9AGAR|nr:hypothetical protein BT96DRAFT_1019975 [Gymnopus androsaceus JB14]
MAEASSTLVSSDYEDAYRAPISLHPVQTKSTIDAAIQEMFDNGTASQAWDYARALTISDTDVAVGSIPAKTFNFTKTCSGATLVGGTFWSTSDTDTTIFGESTAFTIEILNVVMLNLYPSRLSAYLYQATSSSTYLDAAEDSGAFLIDVIISPA